MSILKEDLWKSGILQSVCYYKGNTIPWYRKFRYFSQLKWYNRHKANVVNGMFIFANCSALIKYLHCYCAEKLNSLLNIFLVNMENSVAVYRSVTLYVTNLCAQCGELSTLMALLPFPFSKTLKKIVDTLACANHSPERTWQRIDKLYKI